MDKRSSSNIPISCRNAEAADFSGLAAFWQQGMKRNESFQIEWALAPWHNTEGRDNLPIAGTCYELNSSCIGQIHHSFRGHGWPIPGAHIAAQLKCTFAILAARNPEFQFPESRIDLLVHIDPVA